MTGRIKTNVTTGFQLPEVGKVKIGKKSEKGYPMSLDYFIGYGKYASFFEQAFGDKPQKIQIIFISDDPGYSCNERYELRNSAGDLFASGDGENFKVWDKKIKDYKQLSIIEYPELMSLAVERCNEGDEKKHTDWKIKLTLRFIILNIPNVMGIWSLETGGAASSIKQIRDTFDFVQERAGTVTRILFDLCVVKHKSQKPGDPSAYPVLSLIPNMSDENLLLLGKMKSQINFSQINYLNDERLLMIERSEPKQLAAKAIQAADVFNETIE